MASNPEIKVIITGDVSGARNAVTEAEGIFGGASTRFGTFATAAGTAIGNFAVDAARGLVNVGMDSIGLAQNMETLSKKADTVFGDSVDGIRTWADEVNESFGLSDEAVVGLAANMGDLLVPLGFTREEAANMSQESINLAGALSAWSGGAVDAAEVSDILTKAYLGETDGLKQLGIAISADEIAKRAAENAANGLTFATDAQAKAYATQQLVMEKSTDAQSAWTDGTMDATKKSNEMKAAWEDAKVALGNVLLPIVQTATTFIVDTMIPAFQRVAEVVAPAFEAVIDAIRGVVNFVQDHWQVILGGVAALGIAVLATLVPAFVAWAASAIAAAAATLAAAAPFILIGAAIAAVGAAIVYAYQNFDWFRNTVDTVARFMTDVLWPALQQVFNFLIDVAVVAVSTVVDWIQQLWTRSEGLRAFLVGAFSLAISAVVTVIDTLWTVFQTVFDWAQDLWDRLEGVRGFLVDAFTLGIGVAVTAIDTIWTAFQVVWQWAQDVWNRLEGVRGFLAAAFSTGVGVAKAAIDGISIAFAFAWQAAQDIWDKTEGLRGFLAGLFTTGVGIAKTAIDGVATAFSTVWQWAEDLWTKTEGLRAFLVGTFTAGLNLAIGAIGALGTAFSTVLGWLDSIIGKAQTAVDIISKVLGAPGAVVGAVVGGPVGVVADAVARVTAPPTIPISGAYASGTMFAAGGLSLVGENGPELVNLPRGSRVYNASDTARMGRQYVDNRTFNFLMPAGARMAQRDIERWNEINYDL